MFAPSSPTIRSLKPEGGRERAGLLLATGVLAWLFFASPCGLEVSVDARSNAKCLARGVVETRSLRRDRNCVFQVLSPPGVAHFTWRDL